MHDRPDPCEILTAAAAFLRRELIPALPPELSFKTRILANALDLVARQTAADGAAADGNHARLAGLLGREGSEEELAADLARRIEEGAIALTDPALIDHLWTTTLAKLAVDQPNYASYRAETGAAGLQE